MQTEKGDSLKEPPLYFISINIPMGILYYFTESDSVGSAVPKS